MPGTLLPVSRVKVPPAGVARPAEKQPGGLPAYLRTRTGQVM